MAKHLTKEDVDVLLDLIDGWQGKFTWGGLVDAYKNKTGHKVTRQTLSSHEEIFSAYDNLKRGNRKSKSSPPTLAIASQRIERLEAENSRLKKQVSRYEEKFARWLYNSNKKGITVEELNQKLPDIDRGRTD